MGRFQFADAPIQDWVKPIGVCLDNLKGARYVIRALFPRDIGVRHSGFGKGSSGRLQRF